MPAVPAPATGSHRGTRHVTDSDFRLYDSNALDMLAQLLAVELARPVPGRSALEPDVILIPQVAMRRWLQATLAEQYGIAANLEFLTPGEFVGRALAANVPGEKDDLDAAALCPSAKPLLTMQIHVYADHLIADTCQVLRYRTP